jgi:hypothetical protein
MCWFFLKICFSQGQLYKLSVEFGRKNTINSFIKKLFRTFFCADHEKETISVIADNKQRIVANKNKNRSSD